MRLAALYAYESQVPEIATTIIDGLKEVLCVTQPEGLAYFPVHEEADKAHRASVAAGGWKARDGMRKRFWPTTNERSMRCEERTAVPFARGRKQGL